MLSNVNNIVCMGNRKYYHIAGPHVQGMLAAMNGEFALPDDRGSLLSCKFEAMCNTWGAYFPEYADREKVMIWAPDCDAVPLAYLFREIARWLDTWPNDAFNRVIVVNFVPVDGSITCEVRIIGEEDDDSVGEF